MAMVRLGGPGIGLNNPLNFPTAPNGVAFTPIKSNQITLQAAEIWNIPAGTYMVQPGPYTFLQILDPVTAQWKAFDTAATKTSFINSDGGNYRLANLTGCPIGAVVTTASSSLTNGIGSTATGLTVVASAGSSTWVPVVGGAISTSPTQVLGGSGYLYPPTVVFDAPPSGGIQATGLAVVTSNAVASITVTNQGAGYTTAPGVTFINDARDTAGSGASFTTTLTGSGTLTALYPSNPGTALTATPTFTFTPSGAAATAVMNYTVTGVTLVAGGSSYGNALPYMVTGCGLVTTASSVLANPSSTKLLTVPRPPRLTGSSTSGGAVQVSGTVIDDAGLGIQLLPLAGSGVVMGQGTAGAFTFTVGGTTDTSFIQPI